MQNKLEQRGVDTGMQTHDGIDEDDFNHAAWLSRVRNRRRHRGRIEQHRHHNGDGN